MKIQIHDMGRMKRKNVPPRQRVTPARLNRKSFQVNVKWPTRSYHEDKCTATSDIPGYPEELKSEDTHESGDSDNTPQVAQSRDSPIHSQECFGLAQPDPDQSEDYVRPTAQSVDTIKRETDLNGSKCVQSNQIQSGDTKRLTLTLSQSEWLPIRPDVESSVNHHRRLKGGWASLFAGKLNHVSPGCVLVFKLNQVKRRNSRKKNAPFFRGKAICKREFCQLCVQLTITAEPASNTDVDVDAVIVGNVCHTDKPDRRHLSGKERSAVARKAHSIGAINYYYDTLANTADQTLKDGNLTTLPKPNIIRKAVADELNKERLHKDFVQEVALLQDAYRDNADDPEERYAGYIQYFALNPFTVILFSPGQVSLVCHLHKQGNVDFYLDSTGKVLRQIPGQKRPYLYSFVIKPPESPPLSVADMITTDHTIPSIAHFLLFFRRSLLVKCPSFRPRKVETDWSYPLIQSVLKTFNNCDLMTYLRLSLSICRGHSGTYACSSCATLTVIHLCVSHMTKTFSRALRKITRNASLHKFIMKCFALLSNETTLNKSKEDFRHISIVLRSQCVTVEQKKCLSMVLERYASLADAPPDEVENSDDTRLTHQSDETCPNPTTIKEASPWTAVFKVIDEECKEGIKSDTTFPSSEFFCPDAVELLLERFMPIFPLWSGVLLGDLSRFTQSENDHGQTLSVETRDSNACVESWFKAVKVDILRNTTRHRPSQLISKMKRSINGRLKEASAPQVRSTVSGTQKSVCDIGTTEEKWERKKRRKNVYQPKKKKISRDTTILKEKPCRNSFEQKTVKPYNKEGSSETECMLKQIKKDDAYPAVPRWGGQQSNVTLQNTCTIDNFLTIAYLTTLDRPQTMSFLQMSEHDCVKALVKSISFMKEEKFIAAKMTWITLLRRDGSKNVNLYGGEDDMFASLFHQTLKSQLKSSCSSDWCPQKVSRRSETGCFIRASSGDAASVGIDRLVQEWIEPGPVKCKRQFRGDATVVPKELVITEKMEDLDEDISVNTRCCAGQRSMRRVLDELPPVLTLPLSDLIQLGCLSRDVTTYPDSISIHTSNYTLAGVTLYRNNHFVCCMNTNKYGWLFYDGLVGYLSPLSCCTFEKHIPSHAIYMRY